MLKRGGSRIFRRRGTPLKNGVTDWWRKQILVQNTSCTRKPQVISGGVEGHPLHPPPRSAPVQPAVYGHPQDNIPGLIWCLPRFQSWRQQLVRYGPQILPCMLPLGPHGHVMAVMQNDAEVPRQWMLRLASLEWRIALKRKSLFIHF